ncbi:MAG: hypothetical protein ACREIF_13875 [Chthoniobacterales bacterium]
MNKTLLCVVGIATLTSLRAAQPSPTPGRKPFPHQFRTVDGLLVPVPSEIFNTLDKFRQSNWRAVQRPELARWKPPGDQAENALLLGAVIAEGFIAVEAEDATEAKSVGRAVLKLARSLGVERAALRRSRSIVDYAEKGDWPAVRREWDGVLPDVQQGMKQLKSEQLAQLVSLGGWVRGSEAFATLVLQNYSRQDADLLRQPALFDHFEKQLAGMSGDVATDPVVAKMRASLPKVRQVLGPEGAKISREKVQQISIISTDLLKSLNR